MNWNLFQKSSCYYYDYITVLLIEIGHHCCCLENLNWNVFSKIKLLLLQLIRIVAHCCSLELLHFVIPHQMRIQKNNWWRHECLVFDEDMIHCSVEVWQNITMFLFNLCFFLYFSFKYFVFPCQYPIELHWSDPLHKKWPCYSCPLPKMCMKTNVHFLFTPMILKVGLVVVVGYFVPFIGGVQILNPSLIMMIGGQQGWLKSKDVHVKWLSKCMTLFGLMFP